MSPSFRSCSSLTIWCIGSRGSVCPKSISTPLWIRFGPTSWYCQPNSSTEEARTCCFCLTTTTPSGVHQGTQEGRETSTLVNLPNLQVTASNPFSIFKGAATKNVNLTHY